MSKVECRKAGHVTREFDVFTLLPLGLPERPALTLIQCIRVRSHVRGFACEPAVSDQGHAAPVMQPHAVSLWLWGGRRCLGCSIAVGLAVAAGLCAHSAKPC